MQLLVCTVGIGSIFLSHLYQNLLLSSLLRAPKILRLQSIAQIAEALKSDEYELVNDTESELSRGGCMESSF